MGNLEGMNYRLLLAEMLIDYAERFSEEGNSDKRKVYREVDKELSLALDIEPKQTELIQDVNKLINNE